ncbi:MAG: PAC2 family protein [Actinomycetota bacterium]
MTAVRWTAELPPLRSPILVTAFEGLFDVGGAATGAVESLRTAGAVEVGSIDGDTFFDFTEHRPMIRLGPDGARRIEWPDHRIHSLELDDEPRDLVLVDGIEPHLRWRGFSEAITHVAETVEAAMVVTFGAMIAEVPHTRPPSITGSTTDPDLAAVMRLGQPSYQGPTGVIGVLHEHLERRGVPAVSLRASVPHYVSGSPNPKASRALLERFERITGLPTRWASLDTEARDWETRVNEAMADDDDVIAYVENLERRYDSHAESHIPNADDLAAEFERFLRQQDD